MRRGFVFLVLTPTVQVSGHAVGVPALTDGSVTSHAFSLFLFWNWTIWQPSYLGKMED